MEVEDTEGLPSFFAQASHVPAGVDSLIGELEEAGLLEDEDDENLEMNMETFGAASMADIEQSLDGMMSLDEIEASMTSANVGTEEIRNPHPTPPPKEQPKPDKPRQNKQKQKPAKTDVAPASKSISPPPGMAWSKPIPPISAGSALTGPPGMSGPPGISPGPSMTIPIGVDPATGKTIYGTTQPQNSQVPPPPMKSSFNSAIPPPPPPMRAGDARSQQYQNQRSNKNQNQYSPRTPSQSSNGTYAPGSRPPARTPFITFPPSVPKRGKLMSGSEVATVLHAHMRSLEIIDPYREDFYYHHYMLKERRRLHQELSNSVLGAKCSDILPKESSISTEALPLPVWQETKEKAVAKKDKLWCKFAENTKEWEKKNEVFGHTQKSNPHRPKALLNLSSGDNTEDGAKAGEEDDAEDEEIFIKTAGPFSGSVWGAKKAIEDAKVSLLNIDEYRRLLSRSDIDETNKQKTNLLLKESVTGLQKSLGISNNTLSDARLLEAITQQEKGKKLLATVFKLLPTQAAMMLPTVLKVVYMGMPLNKGEVIEKFQSNVDTKMTLLARIEAETLLLKATLNILSSPDPKQVTFQVVKSCMEEIITPHIPRQTLGATLHSSDRVKVIESLIEKGNGLVTSTTQEFWNIVVPAFYELASKPAAN